MTHPKGSDVETIPVVVCSDERIKKDTEDDRIDEDRSQRRASLGVDPGHCLPPSETGESVPGDMPRLQQTAPVGAVKGESIILKEVAGSEPSSGTDNGDDENVKRLDEAMSRLDVKDEDDPKGMPHSSLVSATQLRVPETESSDTSLDAVSNECGAKGSGRLSESSLESDGNVSDVESDIDSDGICSISDPHPPRDSHDQLVARGPTRGHSLQSRHQGKPYDRQSTSLHIVTKEQDDELKMLLEMSPDSCDGSQHSSPQEGFDSNYVDDWLDTLEPQDTLNLSNGNDLTGSMASPGQVGLNSSGSIFNSHVPTQQCANVCNSHTALITMTTTPCASNLAQSNIFQISMTDNIPRPDDCEYMSGSQAPMQSTIPTVVEDKINESETAPKKKKKRTSKAKRGTPTLRKVATKSECQSSVQQTPPPFPLMLSQGPVSATPIESSSLMMEDAMHLIARELSNNPPNGTPGTQTRPEVLQQWLHASDTQTACVPMPSDPVRPVQQLPVQQATVFSQSPQTVLQAPPSVQSRQLCLPLALQHPATTIYLNQDPNIDVQQVAPIAIQSSPQHLGATPWGNNDVHHVAPDVQVLHHQPGIPPPPTATMSYGTSQPQMLMANAGLRPLVPSSGQYKLTTAGSLGAPSLQLYAFQFQPVRPVRTPTEPTSRLQKIVPKPT